MAKTKITVTRAELARALRAGAEAARAGESHLTCPWSAAGSADDRLRVAAWIRGWTLAQPKD